MPAAAGSSGEPPLTFPEKALLCLSVLMFVVYNSGLLTIGILPVKPRDATLALEAMTFVPLFFCRLRFCLPAMIPILLPVIRVLDATFLHRYDMRELGDHFASVIKMVGPVLVTWLCYITYCSRVGKRFAVYGSITLICVMTATDLYEWFGFAKWTSVSGRMSGWLEHPNTAPTYALMCLCVLYVLNNQRFWWNMFFTLLTGIPAMLSISRSCMMIYFGTVAVYVLCNFKQHTRGIIILICAIPPMFAAFLGAVEATASHGRIRHDEFTEGRFDAIFKGDVQGLASQERGKDLRDGWEGVLRSPMWGYGPGASRGEVWQPHNQVVAIWLDLGIFGMLYYVGILLWALWRYLFTGGKAGYLLMPLFLNIPCQHWLVEMVPYWMVFIVAYNELFKHRIEFRLDAAFQPGGHARLRPASR